MNNYRMGTKCVQAGYKPGNGEPRQIPIIQSTTYKYNTSEDMGKLFDLEAEGILEGKMQVYRNLLKKGFTEKEAREITEIS